MTRVLFCLAIVLLPVAPLGATGSANPAVSVREQKGVYHVTAQFAVAAPRAAVLSVLSDFDGIPRFLPDVKTSIVRARAGTQTIVEQEAVSKVLMFSKRVHLVLEIEQRETELTFRDICGKSFETYQGAWRVTETPAGATVVYELAAAPAFDVPQFVLMRLLKGNAADTVSRIRQEIETRHSLAGVRE